MADRTPIIVAAIGLLGIVAAAAIANPRNVRELLGLGGGAAAAEPASNAAPAVAIDDAIAPPDLGGRWTSDDGYDFAFVQTGATFSYRRIDDASDHGSGRIAGRALSYAFSSPEGDGTCTATVRRDGETIVGSCTRGSERWLVNLRRSAPTAQRRLS